MSLLSAGIINDTGTTTITSFESDLSAFSGHTNEFDITDQSQLSYSATDGSQVVVNPAGLGYSEITSTPGSGLANYFSKGQVAALDWRADADDGEVRMMFGVQDTDNWYAATYSFETDELRIRRFDGTLTELAVQTGVNASVDTWYTLTVTWDDGSLGGSDNDITVELNEVGGSSLGTASTTDSTFASESGVGVAGQSNETAAFAFDNYRLTQT